MAESEVTEKTTETQETTETTDPAPSAGLTAEEFNRAFSAREKALMAKLDKKLSSLTPLATAQDPESTTDGAKGTDPTVLKLQKKLHEMEKREKAASLKAQQAELRNSVTSLLKDKVSPDWIDVAVEKIQGSVSFENESPQYLIDDVPYSLSEGVQNWLSQESNKRFLPPKATAKPKLNPQSLKTPEDVKNADSGERWEAAANIFLNS